MVGEYNVTDPEFFFLKILQALITKLSNAYPNQTSPIRTAQVKLYITHMVAKIPLPF